LPPESNFYQKNQLLISVLVFIVFVVILISSILLAFQGIDNTNYATADADGDLVSNIDEYKAGSNLSDSLSFPLLSIVYYIGGLAIIASLLGLHCIRILLTTKTM